MMDPTCHLVTSTSGGNKDLDTGRGSPVVSIQSQENLGPELPNPPTTPRGLDRGAGEGRPNWAPYRATPNLK